MLTTPRDGETVESIQGLLLEVFRSRDELAVTAELVPDEGQRIICQRLSCMLGGQAAALEQIVVASGFNPASPPTDNHGGNTAKLRPGDAERLLRDAAQSERKLADKYGQIAGHMRDLEIARLLRSQRADTEFAECILRQVARA